MMQPYRLANLSELQALKFRMECTERLIFQRILLNFQNVGVWQL